MKRFFSALLLSAFLVPTAFAGAGVEEYVGSRITYANGILTIDSRAIVVPEGERATLNPGALKRFGDTSFDLWSDGDSFYAIEYINYVGDVLIELPFSPAEYISNPQNYFITKDAVWAFFSWKADDKIVHISLAPIDANPATLKAKGEYMVDGGKIFYQGELLASVTPDKVRVLNGGIISDGAHIWMGNVLQERIKDPATFRLMDDYAADKYSVYYWPGRYVSNPEFVPVPQANRDSFQTFPGGWGFDGTYIFAPQRNDYKIILLPAPASWVSGTREGLLQSGDMLFAQTYVPAHAHIVMFPGIRSHKIFLDYGTSYFRIDDKIYYADPEETNYVITAHLVPGVDIPTFRNGFPQSDMMDSQHRFTKGIRQ